MNTKELTQNVLLLLKLDSQRLYDRIKYRAPEYLVIFSSKRTREHFKEIFKNRYDSIEIEDLKLCGEDVIKNVDQFYHFIDEMKWYLNTTEDMPGTVNDKVHKLVASMEPILAKLHQAIDLRFHVLAPGYNPDSEPLANPLTETPQLPDLYELNDLKDLSELSDPSDDVIVDKDNSYEEES